MLARTVVEFIFSKFVKKSRARSRDVTVVVLFGFVLGSHSAMLDLPSSLGRPYRVLDRMQIGLCRASVLLAVLSLQPPPGNPSPQLSF